jgi:branched-chain amino acid transport system substrate-binding protein
MKSYWKTGLAVTAAVGLGTTFAACGSSDDKASSASSSSSKDPIVIGFSGAQTGFYNLFDGPTLVGAKIAVNEINAKGGVLGRQLKITTQDSKSNVNTGVQATLDLIKNGADMIMPMIGADWGGPSARMAQQKEVLSITGSGSPKFGFQGVGPLAYNSYPGNQVEAAILAEWAYEKGWRKPYLLCNLADDYNRSNCKYFRYRFEQLAGKGSVVGEDNYGAKDTNIATQVSRLRSTSQTDVILLADYPPQGASSVRQIRAGGIKTPIIGAAAFDGDYWHASVPNLSDFYNVTMASIFGDDPTAKINDVFKSYAQVSGKPPSNSVYPMIGYTSIEIYARALQKAGTTDTKAVAAVLDAFKDEPFLAGPVTYSKSCHIPTGMPMALMETVKGKVKFVKRMRAEKVPPAPC